MGLPYNDITVLFISCNCVTIGPPLPDVEVVRAIA